MLPRWISHSLGTGVPCCSTSRTRPGRSQQGPWITSTVRTYTWTQKVNFWFARAEVLPGNIGYVVLNGFSPFERDAGPTCTAAFRFVSNTKALIVDLRKNTGGSPYMVNRVESHFLGIPFARTLNPYTHTNWEGLGVRPDIAVPADKALETVLQRASFP